MSQGYSTGKKNYSQRQRRSYLKKLQRAKGEKWLPREEYQKLLAEKNNNTEFYPIPPPLPQEEPYKPPEPPVEREIKVAKGTVHPDVFKKLSLDAKIVLIRKNFCKHLNDPKRCRKCISKWKQCYKIPKLLDNSSVKTTEYHKVL